MVRKKLLCLILVTCWLSPLFAEEDVRQDKKAAVEGENLPVTEQPTEANNPETEQNSTRKTPDTFIPTEDISEDLSVSYPVDI